MRVDVPIRVTDSNIRHDNNANSNMPKLNKGDSVLAQVVSKNGDIITLQQPDGTRMVANVMSDVILSLGDEINMTVLGQSGRQVMMQLNTVEAGTVEIGNNELQINPFVTLETQVSHIFKNMNLQPNQQIMNNVLNMLQQNEGLSPRTAVFLALNNIEPNAQNIETINNMLESNVGAKLTQIVNQIISQNENIDNGMKLVNASTQSSANDGNVTANTNTVNADNTNSNNVNNTVANGQTVQVNAESNQQTQQVSENAANDSPQTVENTVNNESSVQSEKAGEQTKQVSNNSNSQENVENNKQDNAVKQTKGDETQTVKNSNVTGENKGINQQQKIQSNVNNVVDNASSQIEKSMVSSDEAKILAKVLSVFNKINSEKNSDNKIFDSKEEMQSKLTELKDMVKNSDIKNKDAILSKAENALMEKNIESDINRFTYVQIPISNNQNTQTAEVFVYRRKKKSSEADSENFSILLGLDTINLGRIETLVKIERNNVSLKMSNENKKASNLIKKYATSLGKELKEVGFNLTGIKVEDLYEKTTIINAEETLMRLDTNVERRVDYRI